MYVQRKRRQGKGFEENEKQLIINHNNYFKLTIAVIFKAFLFIFSLYILWTEKETKDELNKLNKNKNEKMNWMTYHSTAISQEMKCSLIIATTIRTYELMKKLIRNQTYNNVF